MRTYLTHVVALIDYSRLVWIGNDYQFTKVIKTYDCYLNRSSYYLVVVVSEIWFKRGYNI